MRKAKKKRKGPFADLGSSAQEKDESSVLARLHDPNLRIAIVGRPNAGKSTLFNKLLGRRYAITSNKEHTTRDVHEKPLEWRNKTTHTNHFVTLIDTPGTPDNIDNMIEQTESAITTADVAFFVTSYKEGITPNDKILAKYLLEGEYKKRLSALSENGRGMNTTTSSGLAVVHIINKCDHMAEWDEEEWDELNKKHIIKGFGKPFAISAEHSIGFNPMRNLIEALNFRSQKLKSMEDGLIRMAIVGRANVGKSTLFNQLIGENRVLVSETPGTSRDSIELFAEFRSNPGTEDEEIRRVLLVDTAGLRKNKDLKHDHIEQEANQEAMRAMRYANVVVIVVDASEGLQRKDMNILRTLEKHGRSVVLALNKWDMVKDPARTAQQFEDTIDKTMKVLAGLPMVVLSAKHATNVPMLMEKVVESYDRWNTKVPITKLNQFLKQFLASRTHVPSSWPTIKYITQIATRPPTFALFFKGASVLPEAFEKQIRNALREEFDLHGLPIRIKARRYEPQQE